MTHTPEPVQPTAATSTASSSTPTSPWIREQAFLAGRAPRCSHLADRPEQVHIWAPAMVQELICSGCFATLLAGVRRRRQRDHLGLDCDHCAAPAVEQRHTDLGLLQVVELRCRRCQLEEVES